MLYHIEYASYIAVIAYAISGTIIGIQNKFDILGVFLIAIVNTISGGVMRDLLADKIPTLLSDPKYIYLILLSVSLTLIFKLYKFNLSMNGKIYIICDAIGLSSFSIMGGLVAIEKDLNLICVISFAMITAIGGSIARDIILNKVPLIFKTDFYAEISIILGFIIFLLQHLALLNSISIFILLCFGVVLRLIAYLRKWHLSIIDI